MPFGTISIDKVYKRICWGIKFLNMEACPLYET
jgi:hypothetical protein